MSLRPRGIFSAILLVALAATSAFIYAQVSALYRLPDLETADRDGLLKWIVLADLPTEPSDTSERLLGRLEKFATETDWLSGDEESLGLARLSADQLLQVRRNVEHLRRAWFHRAVDGYHAAAEPERASFLDRQIVMLFLWAEADWQLDAVSKQPQTDADYGAAIFDSLEKWKREADSANQVRMKAAITAGFLRWLATYDLAEQTPELRRQVAARLERHLIGQSQFSDYAAAAALRGEVESKRFWANADLLAEAWFVTKALEHAQRPAKERRSAVAGHLASIKTLASNWPASSGVSQTAAMERVQKWIDSARPHEREAVRRFASELAAAWLFGG